MVTYGGSTEKHGMQAHEKLSEVEKVGGKVNCVRLSLSAGLSVKLAYHYDQPTNKVMTVI